MLDIFLLILIFFAGASLGSFINVIALRYKTGLSPWKGGSKCFSCGKNLNSYELIPVFSYIFLKGRCSICKSKLSINYLLVELVSGIIILAIYLKFGFSWNFIILSIVYNLLSIIFIYDLNHKIIPDLFVFLFIIFSILYSFLNSDLYTISYLVNIAAPSLLVPLPFFLIWLLSRGRLIGFGDIKLMLGIGLLLGLARGFSAVFISFWAGAAYVIIIMLVKGGLSRKSEIPFGPFLVIGTLMTLFFEINLFQV